MLLKGMLVGTLACMCSSGLVAGSMGPSSGLKAYSPVGTLWGGFAHIQTEAQDLLRVVGTDDDVFLYQAQNVSKTTGVFGLFVGAEHPLSYSGLMMQGGIEYTNFLNSRAGGLNWVGIEPETSTFYAYSYSIRSQQVLAVGKLSTTMRSPLWSHPVVYPYLSVGVGASFNHAFDYRVSTAELGSTNVSPVFASKTQSSFSYSIGLGVDNPISEHLRLGLGYRFSSLGRATLGAGAVVVNQYASPVGFSLHTPHIYANQLIAQVSYVG